MMPITKKRAIVHLLSLVNAGEGGSKYKPDGTTITADADGTMHAHTDPEQHL